MWTAKPRANAEEKNSPAVLRLFWKKRNVRMLQFSKCLLQHVGHDAAPKEFGLPFAAGEELLRFLKCSKVHSVSYVYKM